MANSSGLPNLFKRLTPYALAAVTSIMPPTATRASRERAADLVAGTIENILNNAVQDATKSMASTATAQDAIQQAMLEQALSSMTALGTNASAVNTLSSPEIPEKNSVSTIDDTTRPANPIENSPTTTPQPQSQPTSQPQPESPISPRTPSPTARNFSPDTATPTQPQSQPQPESHSPQNIPSPATSSTENPAQAAGVSPTVPNADFGKTEPTANPTPPGQGMTAADMAPSTPLENTATPSKAPEDILADTDKAPDTTTSPTASQNPATASPFPTYASAGINRADTPVPGSPTTTQATGETPTNAPAEPFQSMPLQSSDSNQGDITAPDAPAATTANTETGEQSDGQEDGGDQQEQPQKTKSSFMQGINKLRFWKDIRAIDKEIKELNKQKKPAEKQLKNDTKKIRPLKIALSGFKLAKVLAYVAECLLYLIGGLFAITIIGIEISLVLWGLAPEVHAFAMSMKAAAKRTKKAMEPILQKVQKDKNIIANIGKRIQALAGRRRSLENASLRDQQEQQTAGTPPQS